jgi:RHS repeat-associated protein
VGEGCPALTEPGVTSPPVKDPDNRTATYSQDPAGEVTAISYSDTGTHGSLFSYDADGRRLSMTDATGTSTRSYDDFGEVVSQTNGAGSTIGYAYDPDGDATSIVYPGAGGRTVTRVFDHADQLSSTSLKAGTTALASVTYPARDTAGQVSSETPSGVPGTAQAYTYTPLEQVKTATTGGVTTPFAYDAADDPTSVGSATQSFDVTDQLCWSTTSAPPATPTCATAPTGSTVYTYNAEGQRTTAVTGTATTTMGYDQEGRLTSVAKAGTAAAYQYDGEGARASKTVNGTTTAFTWGTDRNLITDGITSYLYGPGEVPIEQIGPSATQWYFSDQLGSTRALTDSSGAVVGGYGYSTYGSVSSHTGSASSPLQYAGQYTDAETGYQYLRARYYDPATAQFLTVDPLVAKSGSRYGYAQQNPVQYVDPSGLLTIGACVSAGVGFIRGYNLTLCPIVFGWDTKTKHVTLGSTKTWAKNWQTPTAGLGVGLEVSNAQNIAQLGGAFDEQGGGAGPVSVGSFTGPCVLAPGGVVKGGSLGYSISEPSIEVHNGSSNTLLNTWYGNDTDGVQEN